MISVETIAELLMHKDITVAVLASRIGNIEDKTADEYRVKPDDPAILAVSLGIPEGMTAEAAPSFVQFYFSPEHSTKLVNAVPTCTQWRKIPGNPRASPYLYSCRYPHSTEHLEINIVATLTAAHDDPQATLRTLILQRNVW